MNSKDLALYRQCRYDLGAFALRVMALANNYRNFHVGCAVVAATPGGDMCMFMGANFMGCSGDPKKMCAERDAINRAEKLGYNRFIAFAVAGLPQVDGESGLVSPTLHPCGGCRRMFRDHAGVCEDTIILSINVRNDDIWEERIVGDLWRIHGMA